MHRPDRRDFLLLLGAVAAPAPLCAADPWEARKPAEWSQKDIHRILFDSPWARPVSVSTGGGMPAMSGGRGGRGGRGGGGGMSSADVNPSVADSGSMGRGPSGSGDVQPSSSGPIYIVRWMSARPMKAAMIRLKMGAEADTSEQAKAFVEAVEPDYVLSVQLAPPAGGAPPASRERPANESAEEQMERLKSVTTLSWKGHDKVRPSSVVLPKDRLGATSFHFPKTHPIEPDDRDVEFSTRLGPLEIQRRFRLKEMLFEGALAL